MCGRWVIGTASSDAGSRRGRAHLDHALNVRLGASRARVSTAEEEAMLRHSEKRYADNAQGSSAGLVIRQMEPKNLETPFDRIDSYLTPTELFYIRSHFPAPSLDAASYRLHIDGAVKRPFSLSYEDLRAMRSQTRVATLECAGNSRVFLVPQVPGAQWELGAAGNAEWTGVPLRALLERAGLADDAGEIVLEGADSGMPQHEPRPHDPISYVWSLPRAKAIQPEVLIAYQMNGHDLPLDHGFPVRAIVPGHYGMASVKWLTRIEAVREPFLGYWQTTDYAYWASMNGKPVRRALGEMQLKSEIARPRVYETLAPNRVCTIYGAAWAGETDVTEVAVSTDGGRTWAEAEFLDPVRRHAWRRWKLDWLTPKNPGQYTLLARAKDASGVVQSRAHDEDYGVYVINHSLPIEVFVEDPVNLGA
jgi:DMSO/TMAO reductase YedYZ molybdopterin-dependent catalytic subunit